MYLNVNRDKRRKRNHNEKTSLKRNQTEHRQIKNVAIDIKKTELGLNSMLDIMKANLTEIESRTYVEIIQQILLLGIVYAF